MDVEKKNFIASVVSGILFGMSWWLMIHISAIIPEVRYYKSSLLFAPGMLSSISLIVNKIIPNSTLSENTYITPRVVICRILFFISMSLGFGGIVFAIIVCLLKENWLPLYAMIGIPLHNALILVANLLFKFLASDETEEGF